MSSTRVQIEIVLGALFVLIAGAILIIIGFQDQTVGLAAQEDIQLAEAIEVGAESFTTNCAECHGVEGLGGKGPPFNDAYFFTDRLDDIGWGSTLEDYIVSVASAGRVQSTRPDQFPGGGMPAMPAWSEDFGGPLRNDQIHDIAKYILNWQDEALSKVETPEFAPVPSLRLASPVYRGRAAFINTGCTACHAIPGLSDTAAVGPSLADIAEIAGSRKPGLSAEEYIIESILLPNEFVVEDYQEGLMTQNFGERLTDDQISDIITFLFEKPWEETE